MNHFKTALAAILGIALAGIATTASAQNTKQGYATAVRVQGNVTYSLGKGQPEYPLVAGKYLVPGSIVYTKDNGVVDLVLGKSVDLPQAKWAPDRVSPAPDEAVRGYVSYKPTTDQNTIRMTPNSTLAIDKLTIVDTGADAVSDTELDLQRGKIFASVRKLSGASQYIIKIPSGIAGVRGTLFSISVDGTVACLESTGGGVILALTLADGSSRTFLIAPGQLLDPATGQPANISPQLQRILQDVFNALRTTYFQQVDFEQDETKHHISPTHGHHGDGNNGNGQGNQ
ncbi:MAG: FecR domain-containing protein [Verrucomicrobia bacterium]|nr:FecR domain-containing protein [Verrucomicrobiota bacterium]